MTSVTSPHEVVFLENSPLSQKKHDLTESPCGTKDTIPAAAREKQYGRAQAQRSQTDSLTSLAISVGQTARRRVSAGPGVGAVCKLKVKLKLSRQLIRSGCRTRRKARSCLLGGVGQESTIRCERGDRSCLLYTSPSPRDVWLSRMPSSA